MLILLGSLFQSCSMECVAQESVAYWVQLRLPKLRPWVEFITLLPLVIPAIVRVRARLDSTMLSLDVFNDPNQVLPQRGAQVTLRFSRANLLVLE